MAPLETGAPRSPLSSCGPVPPPPRDAPPPAPSRCRARISCPVAVGRTSRVPSRRIAARLPRPAPLPCAPPVSRCGRARCPHRAAAPRRGARLCPLAPHARAPSPSPLAAPCCAILHYTRAFTALHCLWGSPPRRRAPSRTPLRDPPLHPRQSHAMPSPTARRGSRLHRPWRLATARRDSRLQKQKNRPMNERNFLAPPRGIEPRLLG